MLDIPEQNYTENIPKFTPPSLFCQGFSVAASFYHLVEASR